MVRLNPHEFLYAAMVGVTRQIDNLRNRRQNRYGVDPKDAWRVHIEGACGEMALAKQLHLYWSGNLGNLLAADVAGLQVRTRLKPDDDAPPGRTSLIVHPPKHEDGRPGDDPSHRYVLLVGNAPAFEARGWCFGHEAQQDMYWKEYVLKRAAYFVPPEDLRPIDTLMESL
jgi:hypothetical protein